MRLLALLLLSLLSAAHVAKAQEVVGTATLNGREIILYDSFIWDYQANEAPDTEQCLHGVVYGFSFCGLQDGWRVFQRRGGSTSAFIMRTIEWGRPAVFSHFEKARFSSNGIDTIDLNVASIVAPEFALPKGSIFFLDEARSDTTMRPTRSFLLELDDPRQITPRMAITFWNLDPANAQLHNHAELYMFATTGGDELSDEAFFSIHLDAIKHIKDEAQMTSLSATTENED
jgi:hypothetical protein